MKKVSMILASSVLSICCIVSNSFAATNPVSLLENLAQELTAKLDAKQHLSTGYVKTAIRQIVLPAFDVNIMSRSVVGKRYWDEATPEQKERFIAKFTTQVIQVYSAPLKQYNHDQIKFFPLRGGISENNRVVVHSMIFRSNGQQIPVDYRLVFNNGQWKVYDFSVEGVSMVESYRSQYSTTLEEGGVRALIGRMK